MIISRRKLGLALLAALLSGQPGFAAAQNAVTRDPLLHFFTANTGDLRAELEEARAAGKKAILLMYEQEGCPACLFMKQHVLNRIDVQDLYRRHFVSFTVDINGAVPLTDFDGQSITEKAMAARHKTRATPTFVFHDMKGTEIVRITGAIRDVEEFKLLGEFVASGAYRQHQFAQYKQLLRKNKGS